MPVAEILTIDPLSGVWQGGQRGIAFLSSSKNKHVDAKDVYDSLTEKYKTILRNRIDYWLQGGKHDDYFHGWPNDPEHKNCFCFRWKEAKVHNRMYGFLFNPRPLTNKGYQVCVLVSHGLKTTWETDPSHLDRAEALRANVNVIKEIKKKYPELKDKQK